MTPQRILAGSVVTCPTCQEPQAYVAEEISPHRGTIDIRALKFIPRGYDPLTFPKSHCCKTFFMSRDGYLHMFEGWR